MSTLPKVHFPYTSPSGNNLKHLIFLTQALSGGRGTWAGSMIWAAAEFVGGAARGVAEVGGVAPEATTDESAAEEVEAAAGGFATIWSDDVEVVDPELQAGGVTGGLS